MGEIRLPPAGRAIRVMLSSFMLVALFAATGVPAGFDPTHGLYGHILRTCVHDGLVDYPALRSNPKDLGSYLSELAAVPRNDFDRWSRADQIAFLVNLYDAQTLKLIIDHYPVDGIKETGSFFHGPWSQPVAHLFGETMTLDDVEHGILRKRYREPRIHFALVCAATGCPPLRGEPYVGSRLDEQLDDQARSFLSTASKNRFDPKERVLHLSPIFKSFEGDFTSKTGSVAAFIRPYLPPEARAAMDAGTYRIDHTSYDWSLNDLARRENGLHN